MSLAVVIARLLPGRLLRTPDVTPGLFGAQLAHASHLDFVPALTILESKADAESFLQEAVHDGNLRKILGPGITSTKHLPTCINEVKDLALRPGGGLVMEA